MESFTFTLCKLLIDQGKTEGLKNKIDVFYLMDRMSNDEYKTLCRMLDNK